MRASANAVRASGERSGKLARTVESQRWSSSSRASGTSRAAWPVMLLGSMGGALSVTVGKSVMVERCHTSLFRQRWRTLVDDAGPCPPIMRAEGGAAILRVEVHAGACMARPPTSALDSHRRSPRRTGHWVIAQRAVLMAFRPQAPDRPRLDRYEAHGLSERLPCPSGGGPSPRRD